MTFGSGEYTYRADMDWAKRPEGWTWGWTPGVACDSQGRIFVSSRCDHPLVLFDADGNFLDSWGEGILDTAAAHGIYIDPDDNVYCTEFNRHCIRKFNPDGALVLTIGTPGVPGAQDGDPFNIPTDLAVASTGELFISDGYGNAGAQIRAGRRPAAVLGGTRHRIGAVRSKPLRPDRQTGSCLGMRPGKQAHTDLRHRR